MKQRSIDILSIEKVGHQDPDNPLKFILSTDTIDREGDVVSQDWELKDFKKNPITLFMHDHKTPVGVWDRVKVEKNQLVAYLKLAEKGTSDLIDTVRSLVAQKILKAVSVGFSAGSYEARYDENGNFEGYNLNNPSLYEASLVSVGMNQEALQIAKSFNLSDNDTKLLFTSESAEPKIEIDLLRAQKNKMSLLKISAR